MATRKTFVEAKIQHLPEERWLVMGAPSNGMARLNVWTSLRMADDFSSTLAGLSVASAQRARRFLGSERIVLMYDSLSETEMSELPPVTAVS